MRKEVNLLPPLFGMDDFTNCLKNNNHYCKVKAVLNIPPYNDNLLNYIQYVKENKQMFDRSVIHRCVCTPEESINTDYLSTLVNEQIQDFNLTTNVSNYFCIDEKYNVSVYGKMILYMAVAYVIFILFATLFTLFKVSKKSGILHNFSLYNNLKKSLTLRDDEEFNKLKNFHGFKAITLLYVLIGHMMFFNSVIFIQQPEILEQIILLNPINLVSEIGLFSLSPFVVISSWLVLIQAHRIVDQTGNFTFKNIFTRIIIRYFRFAASFIVVIFFGSTLLRTFAGPVNFDIIFLMEKSCQQNWMYNLFFFNNFLPALESCNPASWYLSNEIQLHVINLLLIYIVIKYKLKELKVYVLWLITCCVIYGSILYYYEEGPIYKMNLRDTHNRDANASFSVIFTHTSTFSNAPSSTVGLIIGYWYLKYKNTIIKPTKWITIFWLILFLGLPTLSIYISFYVKTNRLYAAVFGAVVKPLYAMGMGLGMLGISHNLGGIIKKVFEAKPLLILANFSFGIYICQFVILITFHMYIMPSLDFLSMLIDVSRLIAMALVLGMFVTVAVEEPLKSVTNMLLSQHKEDDLKKTK